MRSPTYAAVIAYHGRPFHGFQRQDPLPTVEAALRTAMATVLGEQPRSFSAASRTDAGVHAAAQVISFRTHAKPDPEQLRTQINARLPSQVFVRGLWRAGDKFHARGLACGKHYRYLIDTSGQDEQTHDLWLMLDQALLIDAMRQSAHILRGPHDFSSFRASGCRAQSPDCLVEEIRIRRSGDLVVLDFKANRYLRKMVRNIVGYLLEVGLGERDGAEVEAVLAARSRSAAGRTAPARGLTLRRVLYPEGVLPGSASGSGEPPMP